MVLDGVIAFEEKERAKQSARRRISFLDGEKIESRRLDNLGLARVSRLEQMAQRRHISNRSGQLVGQKMRQSQ